MKNITKVTAIIFAILLLTLSLASCGNTKTTEAAGDKVKTVNVPLTSELYSLGVAKDDAALLASVNTYIAKIKTDGTLDSIIAKYFSDGTPSPVVSATEDSSKDQLIVVTNAEFAPFEYAEGTTFYGVDMEIVKGLADELGKELVIKNVDFNVVCTQISEGYGDIAAAGLTINDTRTEFVTFSDSYYTASQYIICKADDTTFDGMTTVEQVEAKLKTFDKSVKIGGQSGTTAQYYVVGDEDWGFDGFDVTWVGFDSAALAVSDMVNGNLDYVIVDQGPAIYIVDSFNANN